MTGVLTYLGLGSNLDDPLAQMQQAVAALRALAGSILVGQSGFYRSKPLGPQDQPDFINAVVALRTILLPQQLLHQLQTIESVQGRIRQQRWGPRQLDLDILLYGQLTLNTPDLTIPHPGLCERNFVLYPLYEIAPDLRLPDGRRLSQLVAASPMDGLFKL